MQKITPMLWFDNQAEEAANFYVSIFDHAKIHETTRYNEASSKAGGKPVGSVMTVQFEIEGQDYVALNGGPIFKFNESVSFTVSCKDQQEVDRFWSILTANGGEESMCGWLKDKYGLSWQIVPTRMIDLLTHSTPAQVEAVTAALMKMRKIEIPKLEEARDSVPS